MGASGIDRYLDTHGISKVARQNGKSPTFSASLVKRIIQNPVYCGKIAYGRRRTERVHKSSKEFNKAAVSNEEKLAFRDMVAKAYLQACIISGKNQVTVANYQKNAKGEDELVVTDINMVVRGDHDKPLEREDIATNKNSKKRQSSARMSRKARFKMIRDNIACCSSQKSIAYMKQHVEEN
jgi:hypothetical protein